MLDLLTKRRSIRKYKTKKIEKEKIDIIIKSALLSPSSRNICPWEFIIVDDETIIEKLALSKEHGSLFLKSAPIVIVVVANESISDVWVEDTSIASVIIQLQAESIGLGSCWVQIRNRNHNSSITSEEYVKRVLEIPDDYTVESIIGIGYPDEVKNTHNLEELEYHKIHSNSFNNILSK